MKGRCDICNSKSKYVLTNLEIEYCDECYRKVLRDLIFDLPLLFSKTKPGVSNLITEAFIDFLNEKGLKEFKIGDLRDFGMSDTAIRRRLFILKDRGILERVDKYTWRVK